MEVKDVERCCCVVRVSEAFSTMRAVSCSGVFVNRRTGTLICTGLPFSRFLSNKVAADHSFLSPLNFSSNLKIRVCFSSLQNVQANQCARGQTNRNLLQSETDQQLEADAELQMLVKCLEFKRDFEGVFKDADQWRFHREEEGEKEELLPDTQFLSWFAVLKVDFGADVRNSGTMSWQSSTFLQKGHPVVACGSPFGSLCLDLFYSTISRGIISNLAGEDNTVILTDARCLPGTEGGGLFSMTRSGHFHLIGLIVSPFGWKAHEWIGLSLVCSIQSIFRNIISCISTTDPLRDVCLHPTKAGFSTSSTTYESKPIKYPTVCFVDSGQHWGSGVVVTPELVLTCRHVINGKSTVTLKFHHRGRVHKTEGDVLFSTKVSSPYDVAVVRVRDFPPDTVVPQMARMFHPGESVLVIGYGGLGWGCGPSLTHGVLSKAISRNQQPVMLQTTCAVQAGASGGALARKSSGELLGIVSSNARDLAAKVTYPHLNFSLPVTTLQKMLLQFEQTSDVNAFKELDTTEEDIKKVWRLQDTQSKL